jgi:phytoene dehydrogenase-like protein
MKQLDPRTASDARVDQRDLEQFMDQIQPGWRDVVVEQHFLPRMPAAWLLPLASRGGLGARPSHRSSSVSNVFFAGDWVGPRGWLVDASLDSARAAARAILTSGGAERASLVEPAVVQAA